MAGPPGPPGPLGPRGPPGPRELARAWAGAHPGFRFAVWLGPGGREAGGLTYGKLWARAGGVARALRGRLGLRPGDRALLVYPPGLEFTCAFLGCLRAGVVAVPVCPAVPGRLAAEAERLRAVAEDSGARVALTDSGYLLVARYAAGRKALLRAARAALGARAGARAGAGESLLDWPDVPFASTSGMGEDAGFGDCSVGGGDLAFLQYTSGSTSRPKGVMISHSALNHNLHLISRDCTPKSQRWVRDRRNISEARTWPLEGAGCVVSWLPHFHDMGLIGAVLTPFLCPGYMGVYLSPVTFLGDPLLWVEAASKYRATILAGPDFGYALVARRARERAGPGGAGAGRVWDPRSLDLSLLYSALNGAGIVRPETMREFQEVFRSAGLRPGTLRAAYGLAEHCVYVVSQQTGGQDARVLNVAREPLEAAGEVAVVAEGGAEARVMSLVSCGTPRDGVTVRIVDPGTLEEAREGCSGEVWVQSPCVALGYFGHEEASERCFRAALRGCSGGFLRTGDLGFFHGGELYISGRLKDLIIVNGRNYAPDDVELTVMRASAAIRPGCLAAFQPCETAVACVAEVRDAGLGPAAIARLQDEVTRRVMEVHGLCLQELVLIPPRSIPKTTSGKVRRHECLGRYRARSWETVAHFAAARSESSLAVYLAQHPGARYGEVRRRVEGVLVASLGKWGVRVGEGDLEADVMSLGVTSGMVLGMHGALQSDLQRPVPLSAFIDNRTVAATAAALVEALELCSESEISEGPGAEARCPDGLEFLGKERTDKRSTEPRHRFTSLQRAAGAAQLLMLVAALLATYARRRTVDGEVFSWWRQVPRSVFERDPVKETSPLWNLDKTALKAGFFGRQVDAYHDRWYLWFTALLPLHLATLACLFALRRAGWVRARFSQNAVTLAVSCAHIVLVHGVGCVFSFGAMLATLGVCKAGLPLAVGRPRLYKLLVWALALSMLVLNDYLDANPNIFNHAVSGIPPWTYNGVRGPGADQRFGPTLAFRYLLLRLISYCLDVGEKAHYQKSASAATARDLVSAEDFFVYVTYAPLYLHGPLVQYRSFSNQWVKRRASGVESSDKLGKAAGGAAVVPQPSRAAVRELAGMFGFAALVMVLLHTVYMPTVIFFNLRAGDIATQPVEPVDHFSYAQMFLMFIFLQSHVIFGLARACAQVDGLKVNHDTPVSHFRSSTSLSHHWNWFHTTWRDFFLKYIYLPIGGGYLGLLAVVTFSVLMHGYSFTWIVWGFLNYLTLLLEQGLHQRFRWYKQPNFIVRAVNQALVIGMQMFLFPGFVNSPSVGTVDDPKLTKADWGAHISCFKWNLAFAALNNLRLGPAEQMDDLPGFW